jgi:hypothetical protein
MTWMPGGEGHEEGEDPRLKQVTHEPSESNHGSEPQLYTKLHKFDFLKMVHNTNKWIHNYKIHTSYMNHVLIWRVFNIITSHPAEALATISKLCLHVETPCIKRCYSTVDYLLCFKKAFVHNKISFSVKLKLIRLYYLEG